MARSKPRTLKEYYEWIKFLVTWMVANIVAKGFDSEFVKDQLEPDFNEYDRCYKLCEDPTTDTTKNRAALKNSKKKLDKSASRAVEMIKSNILVTNTDMDTLKIAYATGGGRKPSPAPITTPEFFLKTGKEVIEGRLTVGYKDFGQKLEGKPPHVNHLRYVYIVSDVTFSDRKLLTEQGIDTASPIVMDFPYPQHGKKLGVAGCWVSNAGEEGPWSPVVWFTIP
jgi:hypothetical protein